MIVSLLFKLLVFYYYYFIIIIIIIIIIARLTRRHGDDAGLPPGPREGLGGGAVQSIYEEFTRLAETRLARSTSGRL